MTLAPGGDRIGEASDSSPSEGDAFDLEPSLARIVGVARESKIQPRASRCGDLGSNRRIAREGGKSAGGQGTGDELVGPKGVDPDPDSPDPNHLEGMRQFALGVVAGRAAHRRSGPIGSGHGTRIGTMDGDDFAAREFDIGQETFVAADQPSLDGSVDREFQRGDELSLASMWLRTHLASHHSRGFT